MAKILIIEDNELNLKLMKDILESQGHTILTAGDGKEGLEVAYENDFDLILLDIQMPLVSGYDFMQVYEKNTPIIVVSACAMENEVNKAREMGCVDYITKPIQILDFLATVQKHI